MYVYMYIYIYIVGVTEHDTLAPPYILRKKGKRKTKKKKRALFQIYAEVIGCSCTEKKKKEDKTTQKKKKKKIAHCSTNGKDVSQARGE